MIEPPPPDDAAEPRLVLDADEPLRRFHAGANTSGSAQPSGADLHALAAATLAARAGRPILIVDLRQESHGFVHPTGAPPERWLPLTWYAEHNWGSVGLDDEAARALERRRLGALAGTIAVFAKHGGDGAPLAIDGATDEAERCRAAGLDYLRLPVTDHLRPRDAVVDAFVALVAAERGRRWLHLHCRGGAGRTTTFRALHDLLLHAPRTSLAEVLARHPHYDLTRVPDGYKQAYAIERRDFVRMFYDFAATDPLAARRSWTDWLRGVPPQARGSP